MESYLSFVFRKLPSHSTPNGFDVNEHFYFIVIGWTCFFICLYYLFDVLGKYLFPNWYKNLPDRKRREFPIYAMCLIHHFVVVPRAWLHIYQDYYRPHSSLLNIDYVYLEAPIVPFSFGYLLGDTIVYALPELFRIGTYDYLLHHLLSSWLLVNAMSSSGHMMRYTPHLIACDSTNILFNIAWLLRTSDELRGSTLVMIFEIAFAFLYFPIRCINLPLMLWSAFNQEYAIELGISRYAFIPIIVLQFFWFYKIISGISGRIQPAVTAISNEKKGIESNEIEDVHQQLKKNK